ncbi:MAG: hypothetical protein J6U22_04190 [Bacteroidaceae bacterium]|nr:hypothetical protein [Bacteroidaceae bacterium]
MKRTLISAIYAVAAFIMVSFSSCREEGPRNYTNAVISLKPVSLSVSSKTVSFSSSDAQSSTFSVRSSNINWEISGVPDWITVKPMSGSGDATVTVTVSENESTNGRTGVFTFRSADGEWNYSTALNVSQPGARITVKLETDRVEFDGAAGTRNVSVESNSDEWTVKAGASMTWCSVTRGDGGISLSVTPNTGNTSREGTVEVSTADGVEYLTVVQRPARIISTTERLFLAVEADEESVAVSSEAPWTAETNAAWIDVKPASGQAGDFTVTVEVTANNSKSGRHGYVYLVLSDENKIEIPVSQDSIRFSIDRTLIELPVSGGEETLSLKSNVPWSFAEGVPSWVRIGPESGNGDSEVGITVSANPYMDERSALVQVSPVSLDAPETIEIRQSGHVFNTDSTALYFSDKAGSSSFSVASDGDWTVMSSVPWITLNPESGTGNSKVQVSVTENISDTVRTGSVTALTEGRQLTIPVYQSGKFLNVSSKALEFTSKGGSSQVSLKSNNNWSAVASDSWITLSEPEGSGDCDLIVTTADNPSAAAREGSIVITPEGFNPVRVTVSQAARYLTVSTARIEFFHKGGTSDPVTIGTDGAAVITTGADWLTINRESGTRFTLTATENEAGAERSAIVTVSLTDLTAGTLSREITVVQAYDEATVAYEFVDLGLSVNWATFNVGASKPEESGDYFAWGETEPYYEEGYVQSASPVWKSGKSAGYAWASYRYCKGTDNTLTKYNSDSRYGYNGYTDNKTVLDNDDDVVQLMWGGDWRMPSKAEQDELRKMCTWTWTTQNGVIGYLVTSNVSGYTDRSIFIPAAGYFDDTSLTGVNAIGCYWSNTMYQDITNYACVLSFDSYYCYQDYVHYRCVGLPVRAVCPKKKAAAPTPTPEYVDLGLSVKWATFNVGATAPEEYGDYYAWGETETKANYFWSTYKWCEGSSVSMTKYCNKSSFGNNGFTDTKTTLDPEDDVAHVKWGGNWRMPTEAELDELLNSCTWTWYSSGNTEFGGVAGYKVISKKSGYTGRFIFLPAAGYRDETSLYGAGSNGDFWSGSLGTGYPDGAWGLDFDSDGCLMDFSSRVNGRSVRPVLP